MTPLETTTLTKLDYWSLITVTGPDATDFLQNQLTNSVQSITATPTGSIAQVNQQHRFAGYCSAKGRLQASFWVSRIDIRSETGEIIPEYRLLVSKDLASFITKRLSMFVLRSKVKITDKSAAIKLYGLTHTGDKEVLRNISALENIQVLELPAVKANQAFFHRHIIYALGAAPENLEKHLPNQVITASSEIWDWLEVISGIPRVTEGTLEKFVPQMINMESLNGIDFKKGCYPGQEVVARSQYRGTIKRRLQIASIEHVDAPTTGSDIFHSEDIEQPCGMVVLSAKDPINPQIIHLQVECKLEALLQGQIHLGSPQGPILTFDQLPYALIEI